MKDGAFYINEIRIKHGWQTFAEIPGLLGITKQAVSHIRKGGGISEATANKIGKELGISPGVVLADVNEARAKDSESRKFWHEVSKHLGTAASVALISTLLTLPSSADASATNNPVKQSKNTYILC